MNKKTLLTAISVVLVLAMVVGGTLAYLQDKTEEVVNDFAQPTVSVDLSESGSNYKVVPGFTQTKDPKIEVTANVPSFVFLKVLDKSGTYINWTMATGWEKLTTDNGADIYYREVDGTDGSYTYYPIQNNQVSYSAQITDGSQVAGASLSFTAYVIQKAKSGNMDANGNITASSEFTAAEAWALLSTGIVVPDVAQTTTTSNEGNYPNESNVPVEIATGGATVRIPAGVSYTYKDGEETKNVPSDASVTEELTVTRAPDGAAPGIVVATTDSSLTYDVTLEAIYKVTEGENTTEYVATPSSSETTYIVKLEIGTVDLTGFYHNNMAMTPVASANDVDADGEYFYDTTTGILTFATKSFSPFTATFLFAGGLGTEAYPYLIANYDHLVNVDVGIEDTYPANSTDVVRYKLISDINVAENDGSNWCHSYLYQDSRTFSIDMNQKTIALGNEYLYGYACNLEMYNGSFTFSGEGTSVVDYACYQDMDRYYMNFHDLTLSGTIINNSNAHYGPLVSYAFGVNSSEGWYIASNIVNNLSITSNNSTGYVGGLFGYVQGTAARASVTNCTFNGSIFAANASGFVNPCSFPKAGMESSGNTLNGTIIGSASALPFGCNSNITGGASALTALNNTVAMGDGATVAKIQKSNALLTVDDNMQVVVGHVEGAASYRAAIVFSVGQGFPRYITKDIAESGAASYETGLYKYNVKNEASDQSTEATLISSHNGSIIWLADGEYHFFSEDYNVTSKNATIYVYAYNSDGEMITYQSLSYPLT